MLFRGKKLKDFELPDIDFGLNSLRLCTKKAGHLPHLLSELDSISELPKLTTHISIIDTYINDIQNEIGYAIFHELCNIKTDNYEVHTLFHLAEYMQYNQKIQLPWKLSNHDNIVFSKSLEEAYLSANNADDFYTAVKESSGKILGRLDIDPKHEATIQIMRATLYKLRSTEIFDMYIHLLLADQYKIKTNFINIKGEKLSDEDASDCKKTIKEMFSRYYDQISNGIEDVIPKKIYPNNIRWSEFVSAGREFQTALMELKSNKQNFALLDNQIYKSLTFPSIKKLCIEIHKLLILNSKDPAIFPTMRDMQKLKTGPKLIKIISQEGGVDTVKNAYNQYLESKTKEENELNNLIEENKVKHPEYLVSMLDRHKKP